MPGIIKSAMNVLSCLQLFLMKSFIKQTKYIKGHFHRKMDIERKNENKFSNF